MATTRPQEISDVFNIILLSNEGSSDNINVFLLETELLQVSLVVFGECWKINDGSWQIHALLLADSCVVLTLNHHTILNNYVTPISSYTSNSKNKRIGENPALEYTINIWLDNLDDFLLLGFPLLHMSACHQRCR